MRHRPQPRVALPFLKFVSALFATFLALCAVSLLLHFVPGSAALFGTIERAVLFAHLLTWSLAVLLFATFETLFLPLLFYTKKIAVRPIGGKELAKLYAILAPFAIASCVGFAFTAHGLVRDAYSAFAAERAEAHIVVREYSFGKNDYILTTDGVTFENIYAPIRPYIETGRAVTVRYIRDNGLIINVNDGSGWK